MSPTVATRPELGDRPVARGRGPAGVAYHAICTAVGQMWPDHPVVVEDRIPTVSTVVHRLHGPTRLMYAKIDSDAAGGPGPASRRLPGAVGRPRLERQANQLRRLRRAGIVVCGPVYYRDRVLVTGHMPGPSLADQLLAHPHRARPLLEAAWTPAAQVHYPYRVENAACLEVADTSGAITTTHTRRFHGVDAEAFVASLGVGWFGPVDRPQIQESVARLAASINRLAGGGEDLPTSTESGMAYGGLDPDHIIFGPTAPDQALLCSPQLQIASSAVDAATLLSRTLVLLAATATPDAAPICTALVEFLEDRMRGPHGLPPTEWLRRVVVLWLMDTLAITTTYLAVPKGSDELPARHAAVHRWAPQVLAVAQVAADALRRSDAVTASLHGLQAAIEAIEP